MKSKEVLEVLTVSVFAVSLLFLMIGVIIGSRASPPLSLGTVPPGSVSAIEVAPAGAQAAVLAHQSSGGVRPDYYPPAP